MTSTAIPPLYLDIVPGQLLVRCPPAKRPSRVALVLWVAFDASIGAWRTQLLTENEVEAPVCNVNAWRPHRDES
jgi:hypothetical protein